MTLEEALQSVQEQFDNVVTYSQGYNTDLNSTTLLEMWFNAKKRFIDALGGLIYEFPLPVNLELSEKEKQKKISNFYDSLSGVYQNQALAHFLVTERDGFFSNAVVNEHVLPNGKVIPKGMKLVKAFKYFEEDSVTLNEIQSEASRIIQENKIEGTFCISVHPLDFLSISENTHNWRSCHALDGDFRAGNLSYMCDSTTVICYLKSSNGNVRLPAFPPNVEWNSKKWRMLLYINSSNNCMFAGRQYPFFSDNALEHLQPIIIERLGLVHRCGWSHWHNDQLSQYTFNNGYDNEYFTSDNRVIFVANKFHILDKFVKDESNLHYNDVLKSSCYIPYYSWVRDCWDQTMKVFKVGSKPICPVCAKRVITNTDTLCCDECYENIGQYDEEFSVGECECCGHLIYEGEEYHYVRSRWDDSVLICDHCYEVETFECEACGDVCLSGGHNMMYDKETHQYVCMSCYEALQLERHPEGKETTEEVIQGTIHDWIPIQVTPPTGTIGYWTTSATEGVTYTTQASTSNSESTVIPAENVFWSLDAVEQHILGTVDDTTTELPF